MILDLSELSFIDSSGIAMVIGAFRAATNWKLMHTVVASDLRSSACSGSPGTPCPPLFMDKQEALAALTDEGSD